MAVLCGLSANPVGVGQVLGYVQSHTQGPSDECFMTGMWDLVLKHTSSTSFGSLRVILAPCVGCRINDVTTMVESLGKLETHLGAKRSVDGVLTVPCLSVKQHPRVGDQDTDVVRLFRGWSRLD